MEEQLVRAAADKAELEVQVMEAVLSSEDSNRARAPLRTTARRGQMPFLHCRNEVKVHRGHGYPVQITCKYAMLMQTKWAKLKGCEHRCDWEER